MSGAREISRAAFDEQAAALRTALVEAQRALAEADFPVIVLFAGVDGAGKGETVNLLTEWLDPRRIVTHAYDRLTEEEGQRPEFWRYWRDLPARGRFGLFLSAWYSAPLLDRAYGRIGPSALDRRLARIAAFERTLADDGALILKFWMHLDREAQQKRLEALQKHPRAHWRISQWDWRNWHRYEHFNEAAEHIITRTSTAEAPWLVVDGRYARYRSLTVLGMARRALEARLAGLPPPDAGFRARAPVASPAVIGATVREVKPLSTIDQARTVGRKVYEKSMARLRADLYWLAAQNLLHGLSVVLVFEGWDAGGKGRRHPAHGLGAGCPQLPRPSGKARRATRSAPITTSGASGAGCPKPGRSRSSTAAGTAASWSSASNRSRRSRSGGAPTPRSGTSRSRSSTTARC